MLKYSVYSPPVFHKAARVISARILTIACKRQHLINSSQRWLVTGFRPKLSFFWHLGITKFLINSAKNSYRYNILLDVIWICVLIIFVIQHSSLFIIIAYVYCWLWCINHMILTKHLTPEFLVLVSMYVVELSTRPFNGQTLKSSVQELTLWQYRNQLRSPLMESSWTMKAFTAVEWIFAQLQQGISPSILQSLVRSTLSSRVYQMILTIKTLKHVIA